MKKLLRILLIIISGVSPVLAQDFNLQLRGEISYPYSCASIWGYVDTDGTEYALVGTYEGVSIVDVSDPDNPEIKFDVAHTPNLWREIKTYGHYAYATNEVGDGLLIIDLSDLPNSVSKTTFKYTDESGNVQQTGHTLWIDEFGKLFIFGGSYGIGGATIFDLTVDPVTPPFLGSYQQQYIHDGYVRGDTLWASEIYAGKLELVDVSNPANPVPLASVSTPSFFTHNSWPTKNNKYAFTTDEVDNSFLAAYDVSDLSNITEVDRVQSNPGSGSIVHNVHLYNDQFAYTAYYKDGVVLFDVSKPDNMIEVGSYDTDPQESGGGYGGTWGVYPYLPSGNIIVSDLYTSTTNGKLTIFTPTYVSASWLEGTVTDAVTTSPINNAYVQILSTSETDYSDLSGTYKTGTGIPGSYTVVISRAGYLTKELENVTLTSGVTTILDVALTPLVSATITGTVVDSATNELLEGAQVFLRALNIGLTYEVTTDINGSFSIASIYEDSYDVFAGKWGYHEDAVINTTLNQSSGPINLKIAKGYYDDFILDNDWVVSGNAATGDWERGEPVGTTSGASLYNPDFDIASDYGNFCFVTGNGGGDAGFDDVDNGKTILTSPVMDLSDYESPVVSFYSWFANGGGSGAANDTLTISLSDGTTTVDIAKIKNPMFQWVYHEYNVGDFITPNSSMKIIFSTIDLASTGHLLEAAIDKFQVRNGFATGVSVPVEFQDCCSTYPNPFSNANTFSYNIGSQTFSTAFLKVYTILGQEVESYPIHTTAGTINWGNNLAEGVYLMKLIIDGQSSIVLKAVKAGL